MSRPRLFETKKFGGCRDRDQPRLSKSCRDRDFIESLANHWAGCGLHGHVVAEFMAGLVAGLMAWLVARRNRLGSRVGMELGGRQVCHQQELLVLTLITGGGAVVLLNPGLQILCSDLHTLWDLGPRISDTSL